MFADGEKMNKTNVMRILEQKNISYDAFFYENSVTDGVTVAKTLGENPDCVFKTLVTVSADGEHLVFVIPVACTLDLKKAATAAGVKSIRMIPQKELLPLTGYIHGGCSPVGMKKPFRTFMDETASLCDRICVSAGRPGCQIRVSPEDLVRLVGISYCDLTV